MRELINRKPVQILLGIVLIMVWGYNMASFFDLAAGEETAQRNGALSDLNLERVDEPVLSNYAYDTGFRDPFEPTFSSRPTEPPPRQPKEQEKKIKLPVLELTGIVEHTAIVQNTRREVFFVTQGDSVEGALVTSVTEDSVFLAYGPEEFALTFNH